MEVSSTANQFDRDDVIVDRIVTAVAEYEECNPTDLPPLYEVVDPGALGRIAREASVDEVSFSYHGYHVYVGGDGHIRVTPGGES